MNTIDEITRRRFLTSGKNLVGGAALMSMLGQSAIGSPTDQPVGPHFAPKAKRVIYLHMVGGPAQMDLFDYKPAMQEMYDKDLPDSIRKGQRLTTMTSGQARFPIAPSRFKFSQAGECGMWMNTELLPWMAKKADDICLMRSLNTEAINHEPAIAAMQTGNQVTGRPCLGSWASYGLGTMNENLPSFVVLVAVPSNREQEQAISSRLWSSGYLPGQFAGVSFRSKGDPILYINNPPGVPDALRKKSIDGLNRLNEINYGALGDPEIQTRIQQYEMAFRMQASVPELTDMSSEPKHIFDLYGEDVQKPGSFANTALMARRLGRTRRSLHSGLPQQLGPPQQRRRSDAGPMQRCGSALLCLAGRSGTTRHAGRNARHLGRRIRPHDLLPRQPVENELRPRPPPALFQHVDGRRRRKTRDSLRRNRRLFLQHRPRSTAHP